jgi:hypothetical protein
MLGDDVSLPQYVGEFLRSDPQAFAIIHTI